MRGRVASRHVAHSVYSRFSCGFRTDWSISGHAHLVQLTTFQPARSAARSKAGTHCSMWLSPKSTTVRAPFGSPYTHAPCSTSTKLAMQFSGDDEVSG